MIGAYTEVVTAVWEGEWKHETVLNNGWSGESTSASENSPGFSDDACMDQICLALADSSN